jgi:hypothetical protein
MNIEIKGFSEQNNGIMEFPQQNKKKSVGNLVKRNNLVHRGGGKLS